VFKFNRLWVKACGLWILLTMSAAGAAELSKTGEFLDGIAAIVNDGVVLKSQVIDQTKMIIERASKADPPMRLPPAPVLREQLLEQLILNEIQLQRADRIGLQVSDQILNEAIGNIAKQNGVKFEDMPALLAKEGVDYADFRRDLREQITLDQLRQIDVGQRIDVSPREIEQCVADLENNAAIESDYNLSHILIAIPEPATAQEVAAAKAKADDVYQKLQDGANFGEMAIRYSDAQTALDGGSLGWMKGDELPTMYTDVVVAMQAGEVSKPFRSSSSFHIVKVNDIRSAVQHSEINQVKVRHILITPNEIIDDQTAKQELNDALERIKNGEDFGEVAKLMSDDPGSASLGGDLGWAGPDTFTPEFESVVDKTKIGEISKPFRTPFGWHILQVLDRRVYDNTEDLKKGKCVTKIRKGKLDEETELWLRRLRDEAYVDTRV
jgi:peptidyl-prolyl cis-trans isomerase SurA